MSTEDDGLTFKIGADTDAWKAAMKSVEADMAKLRDEAAKTQQAVKQTFGGQANQYIAGQGPGAANLQQQAGIFQQMQTAWGSIASSIGLSSSQMLGLAGAAGAAYLTFDKISNAAQSTVKYIFEAVDGYKEAELAATRLAGALKTQGGPDQARLSGSFAEQSNRIGLTLGDPKEKVAQAQQIALQFQNLSTSQKEQLIEIAADVTGRKGGDLASNTQMIGRAANDPAQARRMLRQLNVRLSDDEEKQVKYFEKNDEGEKAAAVILNKIAEAFKGGSAEFANTFIGRDKNIEELNNRTKDTVGQFFSPIEREKQQAMQGYALAANMAVEGLTSDLDDAGRGFNAFNKYVKDFIYGAEKVQDLGMGAGPDSGRPLAERKEIFKLESEVADLEAQLDFLKEGGPQNDTSKITTELGKKQARLGELGQRFVLDAGAQEKLGQEVRKFENNPANFNKVDPMEKGVDPWVTREFQLNQAAGKMIREQRAAEFAKHDKAVTAGAQQQLRMQDSLIAGEEDEMHKRESLGSAIITASTPYQLERARKLYDEEFGGDSSKHVENLGNSQHTARIEGLEALNSRITQGAASTDAEKITKALDAQHDLLKKQFDQKADDIRNRDQKWDEQLGLLKNIAGNGQGLQ